MSHLNEWVLMIARQLRSEAERIASMAKSELYEDAARDTFTRVVLEPFLPASYSVGTGKVVDSTGHISAVQDIVIYRNDYPQFNMPGSHDVFIYESVLATIQVRSKLIRKSFFSAMDQCASLAELEPVIDPAMKRALAIKMHMKADKEGGYVHPDPLQTGRFDLIGRPNSFIYAFTGYQTVEKQLAENLNKWIDGYRENHDQLQMKTLPSVIATQGCFAWRNTAPFTIKKLAFMAVGNDDAPLRLIILQLLQALNRRLQQTSDGYGLKSTVTPYISQFDAPKISEMVGDTKHLGKKARPSHEVGKGSQQTGYESTGSLDQNATEAVSSVKMKETSEDRKEQKIHSLPRSEIKNLSSSPVSADDSSAEEPDQGIEQAAKTSAPLSFYSDDKGKEVGEYHFDPIEPQRPQVEDGKEEADTKEDAPEELFIDTLVETPESMKEKSAESESDSNKHKYVSESLI